MRMRFFPLQDKCTPGRQCSQLALMAIIQKLIPIIAVIGTTRELLCFILRILIEGTLCGAPLTYGIYGLDPLILTRLERIHTG